MPWTHKDYVHVRPTRTCHTPLANMAQRYLQNCVGIYFIGVVVGEERICMECLGRLRLTDAYSSIGNLKKGIVSLREAWAEQSSTISNEFDPLAVARSDYRRKRRDRRCNRGNSDDDRTAIVAQASSHEP